MASEIRVNQLTNRSGLGTITFANGGVQFSGITTFANGEFYVGTGATIINPSTNEFNFHTGGSNRLTINNSGVSIPGALSYEDVKNVDSVGVVTVRSGGYLDVRTGGSINTNATGGSASGTLHKNTTSGEFAVVSGGTGGNNYLSFYTSASAAPTEKLRIASDGKIGIGTDNPTALLHLQGTGGNTQGLYFKNGTHDSVRQYFNNGNDNSDFVITYDGTGGAELTLHATGVLGLNEANGDDVLIGHTSVLDNARLTIGKSAAGFTTAIALHNPGGTGSKIISSRSLVLGADYDNNTGTDGSLIAFETNGTEKVRITSDGEVGIGSAAPTSVLDIVAADPVLTLRDTSTTITNANATLRLAESQSPGVIENYWDVVADTTAGNFGFAIKQNLGGTITPRFTIQPSNGNIGIGINVPTNKLHVVGDIYASDDLIAGDEIRNKVPADFWASDNTFINLNDVGNITHMGGYQTTITSNGYRDTNTQWKSNAINSNTGAAQIVLHPTGKITFGTESNKSNGSNWVVDTKLTITADGELLLNSSSASAYLDVLADETLSASSGTEQELAVFRAAVGNSSQLRFKHVRLSAGTDWTTVATRIQRKIDSTNMGYIDFGTGGGGSGRDIQFGNGNGTMMMHLDNTGKVGIGTDAPVGNLEIRDSSKANLIVAKDGLTVKNNSDLASNYDFLQIGAGGALASYNVETVTASTYLIHNAYRDTGNNWKYRYADTAMRLRMNSPGRAFIFESAASGSANTNITYSEKLRIDSDGNLHLRSAQTNRIVLGSAGGNVGVLTNNENWIRGSGTMIQLNTAGGDYGFEVLGNQKMKLDSSGNLELRSATQTRITFGSAGSSGNDTAWIRGDGDDLMFNVRTGGDFKWEMNGSLVAELTTAKKVQGILVGKREYTVSMPASGTWYYVCTVHSNSLCSQVEFRVNGTRDSTVFNAHFDVLSTHAAPQYHVTSTGCNYTAVYLKMVGNNYGAYNAYMKRSGTTGACDANVRVYPRMNEYIDESEDSGYSSTAFEVTAFSGKRIWSSTANNADLDIHGNLSKGSGSFKIPHPLTSLKDTKNLVHSFIEGPSCDLIYRGTVTLSSGSATVNIDTVAGMTAGTFAALNKNVQCFTTNESGWGAVKGSVSGNTLTITAQDGSSTDNVSWMIVGQRKDDVIKDSSITDANGDLVLEPSIDPTETSPSDSYPSNPSQYDSP